MTKYIFRGGCISNLGAFLEHFTIIHHSLIIHIENYLHVIQNNKVKSLAFSAISFLFLMILNVPAALRSVNMGF